MSLLEPILFLVAILFLEAIETAIFTISKGILIEQDKQEKHDVNVFSRAISMKTQIKEVMVVVLILDSMFQYLLSFYVTQMVGELHLGYLAMSGITIGFSLLIFYFTIVAKIFAINHAKNSIKYFGTAFYFVFIIFKPLGTFFSKISMPFAKAEKNHKEEMEAQKSQLLASLEDFEKEQGMQEEIDMVRGVLTLKDINLNQIMTPRSDFIYAEFSENIDVMKGRLLPLSFRKNVILFEDVEDNIIGTINLQKFFVDIVLNRVSKIAYYIQQPQFFVHTTDVYHVLEFFKTTTNKMVFVIDEDGSISGIVTMTDILNEIVGETQEDNYFIKKNNEGYLIEGTYNIRLLNRKFDLELEEDCSTVGGLIMMHAKKIPKINDSFLINDVEFIVKERTKNKIEMILMKIKK